MYPAFQKYFVEDLTDYYPYDPERARELLAEAGYPDGFSMTITVPSNYQPHIDTATVLVEQLKAVGITAEIQPVEWGAWLSEVYGNRQFQSTVVGVDASNMTARALLERFTSAADDNLSTIRTRTMTPCSSRPRPRPTTQSRQSSTNRWSGT